MSCTISDIASALYVEYYKLEQTPENIASSHWKNFHQNIQIELSEGRIQSLKGYGFGDIEYTAFHHRVLACLTNMSYFLWLPQKHELMEVIGSAKSVLKRLGIYFTFDCFRQACALTLLKNYIDKGRNVNILCIGDGYGLFSMFLKELYPQAKIHLVDLGKTLLFQAHYCQKAFLDEIHYLVDKNSNISPHEDYDFLYCPAEHLNKLNFVAFDVAVNIDSMQEMPVSEVERYFSFLRNHLKSDNIFYCANRVEKRMLGGEVSRYFSYPWRADDNHLIDDLCPWQKYFFTTHREKRGPKIFSIRIPFISYFDGDTHHRLTRLYTHSD